MGMNTSMDSFVASDSPKKTPARTNARQRPHGEQRERAVNVEAGAGVIRVERRARRVKVRSKQGRRLDRRRWRSFTRPWTHQSDADAGDHLCQEALIRVEVLPLVPVDPG